MSKEWFVYFREYKPGHKPKLYIIKDGLNSQDVLKDKRERLRRANAIIFVYKKKFSENWTPGTGYSEQLLTLTECLDRVIDLKRLKSSSLKSYRYTKKKFVSWLNVKGFNDIYPQNFTHELAIEFLDYTLSHYNFSGKTHNNCLSIMKAMFFLLKKRKIVEMNPFVDIAELEEEQGKNFPLTKEELSKFNEYLKSNRPQFNIPCKLTYYCFLRRTELIRIRIQDINLDNNTIIVHSGSAKNKIQQSVTIPKKLESLLRKLNLDQYPGHYYLYGKYERINEFPVIKPDHISMQFSKIRDKLGIDKSKGFYALKHTGVCALYNATKDPYLVMAQCRHSDIRITMVYLRSLGLTVSEKIREVNY